MFEIKTADSRTLRLHPEKDARNNSIVVVDILSVNMERQATVKLLFKELGYLKQGIERLQEQLLDEMMDY